MIEAAWLTINRFCNFKCKWCYVEGTEYSKEFDMPIHLAKSLINLLKEVGCKQVIIIGGEPTYHDDLFEIIDYIHDHGMSSIMITNGYRFHDKDFLNRILTSKLNSLSVSIKAGNRQQYLDLTKNDAYDKTVKAIKNLAEIKNFDVNYTITVSKENIDNIEELVALTGIDKKRGACLSFCSNTFDKNKKPVRGFMCDPKELINNLVNKYEVLSNFHEGWFYIDQSLPECIWPRDFLNMLVSKHQLRSGCHLQRRKAIVFDTQGNVLPCNRLWCFPLGKYGRDFKTSSEFEKFWMREDIVEVYDGLMAYPSKKCISCNEYSECGGGCSVQWFMLDPKEVITG